MNSTDRGANSINRFRDIIPTIPTPGLTVPQCLLLAVAATPLILSFPVNSMFRKALYPIQLYLLFSAFVAPLPPHKSQAELYNLGLLLGTWGVRIVDRVYAHTPENTFLRDGIDDQPGRGPGTYSAPRKLFWAIELILSGRGIGWNWKVGGIPKPDKFDRFSFIMSRLNKTIITFFLVHMVSKTSSLILAEGDALSPWAQLLQNPVFLHLFVTIGWLTVVYGHITLPDNLCSIFLVGTGVGGRWSDPEQWPPMFGDIKESYTLRRCWGKFWHGALRRSTNAPGEWIIDTFPSLRVPKSQPMRLAKRYGLLFLAFAVSGLIHASGSYMVTRDGTQATSDGGALVYFMAQPVAILVEDAFLSAVGVTDGVKPSRARRVCGYVYVATFWFWSFPQLKVVPLAYAHGLRDARGPLFGATRACLELAEAMPFNPATSLLGYLSSLRDK